MSRNLDPRVIRTRKLLRQALLEVIRAKDFNSITIQDIADHAGINRATFYLHYANKQDLMIQTMQEILDELATLPNPVSPLHPHQPDPERLAAFFVRVFQHVARHAEFYNLMLSDESVASFAMKLQGYIEQIGLRWFPRDQIQHMRIPPEVIMSLVSGAFIGIVKWWLKNDGRYSSEDIASQFMQIMLPGILSTV